MKRIVLSGVNMTEGGILTIYKNLIVALSRDDSIEVSCLVHSKKLFDEFLGLENFHFYEYPSVKSSWFKRIWFEFFTSDKIRKKINPDIWFCLHDITARVNNTKQYVYCHNPSPFYKASIKDFFLDKKFYLFTKFYKFLYRINIKRNVSVIVQQRWIASAFSSFYDINNIVVARPVNKHNDLGLNYPTFKYKENGCVLIYPAVPRVFKNMEVLIDSMALLKENNIEVYNKCKILLTFSPGFNKYGDHIIDKCKRKGIENIIFIGFKNHNELNRIVAENCNGIIFPSKLETWGLPLTEAIEIGQNIIAADMPYAKETIGNYSNVRYFHPDDPFSLMNILYEYVMGNIVFDSNEAKNNEIHPNKEWKVINDWDKLKKFILMD